MGVLHSNMYEYGEDFLKVLLCVSLFWTSCSCSLFIEVNHCSVFWSIRKQIIMFIIYIRDEAEEQEYDILLSLEWYIVQ